MNTPSIYFDISQRKQTSTKKKAMYVLGSLAIVAMVAFVAFKAGEDSFISSHKFFLNDYEEVEKAWNSFKQEYKRVYLSSEENNLRFEHFADNYRSIQKINSSPKNTFTVGVNQFADLSDEEFAEQYLVRSQMSDAYDIQDTVQSIPENLSDDPVPDWSSYSQVRQQGSCGGCYAFSSASVLEGLYNRKYNKNVQVSTQQVIACCTTTGGCNGGLEKPVFDYVKANGIAFEQDYPYETNTATKGNRGICNTAAKKSDLKVVNVTYIGTPYRNSLSQQEMTAALRLSPLALGVSAMDHKFRFYQKGVITGCNSINQNHAVTMVAIGSGASTGEPDFYKIKNSWGTNWGEKGFVRVAITPGAGQCGANQNVVYVGIA